MASTRKCLNLNEKFVIIKQIEAGKSQSSISEEKCLPKTTVNTIWKNRKDILTKFEKLDPSVKKVRKLNFATVDSSILDWFKLQRSRNIPMNGGIIIAKAKEFAKAFGNFEFTGSVGWLEKWKRRHNITFRVISGESASVNDECLDNWLSNKWPKLCQGYTPAEIFNCDETGLFYKMLPNKSLHFANEKCPGGKHSKDRLSILFCCNSDGSEKLKPVVIGKSKNPRDFKKNNIKNVGSLPVIYRNNGKAWMTTEVRYNL